MMMVIISSVCLADIDTRHQKDNDVNFLLQVSSIIDDSQITQHKESQVK